MIDLRYLVIGSLFCGFLGAFVAGSDEPCKEKTDILKEQHIKHTLYINKKDSLESVYQIQLDSLEKNYKTQLKNLEKRFN